MSERSMMEMSGRRRVISTSKIKKITAIRKNRSEKGIRADPFGSNPHSNGDNFSRSEIVFFDTSHAKIIKMEQMMMVSEEINKIRKINFPK